MHRFAQAIGATAVAAALAAANYVAWLGWDQEKNFHPATSNYTGPYQVWQVAGFVLVLFALALVFGWRKRPLSAAAGSGLSMLVATWLDWAGPDVELWPVGVGLSAVGTFIGMLGVAIVATGIKHEAEERSAHGSSHQGLV